MSPVQGMVKYFTAVSNRDIVALMECFASNAVVLTGTITLTTKSDIESYYQNGTLSSSNPYFFPIPHYLFVSNSTIAVEIELHLNPTHTRLVGDWFTFDSAGKIRRLTIYDGPHWYPLADSAKPLVLSEIENTLVHDTCLELRQQSPMALISHRTLQRYVSALQTRNLEQLMLIFDLNAQIITSTNVYTTQDEIKQFYVNGILHISNTHFSLRLSELFIYDDQIAVEIRFKIFPTQKKYVADFFTFNRDGYIIRLNEYDGQTVDSTQSFTTQKEHS
ncbi:unnamed protein product [Didymodactylos carnosus]|uniref:SnoaL-like domain-containing protein n=1 Tax=Didymodactylos carnosus TaxID=1234261 RepID=A0A814L994_9BILA|nr:unnamed protein product [Didymodactylos carnosus]CAF1061940.1 unnamed protein product [Didymodactylos carnosus]CAF3662810.1 unnamed protein product [Didymodactylos carnosus]CAF3830133.1 unnamed protein product [Didymodactylos carnosus]